MLTIEQMYEAAYVMLHAVMECLDWQDTGGMACLDVLDRYRMADE